MSSARTRGLNARSLGARAEDAIAVFASDLDLVATKSQRDWEGWDLSADVPAGSSDAWGLPLPPVICRFQVKGTTTSERSRKIARDNILRMVQQPIPWFLMLGLYDGRKMRRLAVTHIDA